jgi:hypothetical protein
VTQPEELSCYRTNYSYDVMTLSSSSEVLLTELDKELNAKHAEWREAWIHETRAKQAAKDAAVREQILRERAEREGKARRG